MNRPVWSVNQFEPQISTITLDVHVNQLHQGYVDKLNKRFKDSGVLSIPPSRVLTDPDAYLSVDDKQFYIDQMGGNVTHTLFWKCITPQKQNPADSKFLRTFGVSYDMLSKAIVSEGLKRFGSGWVWGALSKDKKLTIYSTKNHDTPYMRKQLPIFCVDVWEHAYFIDRFGNREAWLNCICQYLDFRNIDIFLDAHLRNIDILDSLVLGAR